MNKISYALLALSALCAGSFLPSCNNAEYTPLTQSLYVNGAAADPLRILTIGDDGASSSFLVRTAAPAEQKLTVHVEALQSALDAYNQRFDANYTLLPQEYYTLSTQDLEIEAGKVSSAPLTIKILPFSEEMKKSGKKYALPLSITSVTGGDLHLLQGEKDFVFACDQVIVTKALELQRNQTIDLVSLATPVQTDSWSIEMRVKSDDIRQRNNNQAFISVTSGVEGGGEGSGFIYGRWEGEMIQFKVNGHDGLNATVKPESNKWYHIALVCQNGVLSLYLNGQLNNQEQNVRFAQRVQFRDFKLSFINQWRMSRYSYSEVRFWNRAITANQIRGNRFGIDPQTPGLVAYWKFDEGQGNIVKDVTGGGADLHLSTPSNANATYTWVDIRSDQD